MLRNWIKIAFTNYKRNWTSTMINLLGLTIGFTVFILVFLNWQDEKSYESWVPGRENIYLVENNNAILGIWQYQAIQSCIFPKKSSVR